MILLVTTGHRKLAQKLLESPSFPLLFSSSLQLLLWFVSFLSQKYIIITIMHRNCPNNRLMACGGHFWRSVNRFSIHHPGSIELIQKTTSESEETSLSWFLSLIKNFFLQLPASNIHKVYFPQVYVFFSVSIKLK